jgi:uncharacterized damage-inducible protein DinB
MTPDYVRILLDYNYWARDRALASAGRLPPDQLSQNLGSSFGSVLGTLVHIYSAEWIWNRRWHGESPSAHVDTSRFVSAGALREAWLPLEQETRSFVEGLGPDGLSRTLEYRMMSGQPSTSVYWQMIVHVVNHGTYHRGQVATMMRQLGSKPAESTDMVVFFREHAVPSQ